VLLTAISSHCIAASVEKEAAVQAHPKIFDLLKIRAKYLKIRAKPV